MFALILPEKDDDGRQVFIMRPGRPNNNNTEHVGLSAGPTLFLGGQLEYS